MQQVYHSLYARRTSRFQISSYADIWKNVYKGIATHNTEAEVCYLDKTVIINQELFTEGFFYTILWLFEDDVLQMKHTMFKILSVKSNE